MKNAMGMLKFLQKEVGTQWESWCRTGSEMFRQKRQLQVINPHINFCILMNLKLDDDFDNYGGRGDGCAV